jgi:hypothetical protein
MIPEPAGDHAGVVDVLRRLQDVVARDQVVQVVEGVVLEEERAGTG